MAWRSPVRSLNDRFQKEMYLEDDSLSTTRRCFARETKKHVKLVDAILEILTGCKSRRSRRTLKNKCLVAKIGGDTAENWPYEIFRYIHTHSLLPRFTSSTLLYCSQIRVNIRTMLPKTDNECQISAPKPINSRPTSLSASDFFPELDSTILNSISV